MSEEKQPSLVKKSFTGGLMGCFGVLAAIIIVIVVISIAASANKSKQAQKVSDALKSTPATSSSTSPTTTEAPPFKTYQLAEAFDVSGNSLFASTAGDYSWSITGTEVKKLTKVTGGYDNSTLTSKNGTYILFFLNATNTGKEKQDLQFSLMHDLVLVTPDAVKYSQEDAYELTSKIEGNKSYFTDYFNQKEVNPGAKAKDFVIFDVPDQPYKICAKELDTYCVTIP